MSRNSGKPDAEAFSVCIEGRSREMVRKEHRVFDGDHDALSNDVVWDLAF